MGLWGPGQDQRDPRWAEAQQGVGAAQQEFPADPKWTLGNGWWHMVLCQWIWRLQGLGISPHAAFLLQGCGTASSGMRFNANAARSELLCPSTCWLLAVPSPGSWGPQPQLGGSCLPEAPGMCLFMSNSSQLTGNRQEQEYTLKEPAAQGQGQNKSA